ncbi:hypothetical protein ACFL35_13945 [Candidatus Riflebacteria bacterium]
MKIPARKISKGSILLLAAGAVVTILFVYFAFMHVLSGISRQAQSLSQRTISANLAYDLAQITALKIQNRLANPKDPLVVQLCKPLNKWKKKGIEYSENSPFYGGYEKIVATLLKPLQELQKISVDQRRLELWTHDFKLLFEASGEGYQFEKSGVLRLCFAITADGVQKTFVFCLPVDVVLPIPTVLKRFVLWVQNAVPNWGSSLDKELGYNILQQGQDGYLLDQSYQPLVIKSFPFDERDDVSIDSVNSDFIYRNSGFIYLGGKKDIHLNLGNGFGTAGESGHLYVSHPKFPKALNIYSYPPLSNSEYSIRFRDGGFDYEGTRDFLKGQPSYWLPYYVNSLPTNWKKGTFSSVLKLYGSYNEGGYSPTLVIGKVFRRYIRMSNYIRKGYKSLSASDKKPPSGIGIFYFPGNGIEFNQMCDGVYKVKGSLKYNIASVAKSLNLTSFDSYIQQYPSRVVTENYNRGIDYIVTEGHNPQPPAVIANSNPYKSINSSSIRNKFPGKNLKPGNITLSLKDLLSGKAGKIEKSPIGKRSIFHKVKDSFFEFLKKRGLLFAGDVLDLKSVVLIEKNTLTLKGGDGKFTIKSSGAIVVESGDIIIKSGIWKDREEDHVLALIALKGNIFIKTTGEIDALLICPEGTIYNNSGGPLNIYGGVLVNRLVANKSDFNKKFRYGGLIEYDPALALPMNEKEAYKSLIVSSALIPSANYVQR